VPLAHFRFSPESRQRLFMGTRPGTLCRIDLPDGLISRNRVKSCEKKYFTSVFRNYDYRNDVPPRQEGRARRHEREAGCDGCNDAARRVATIACDKGAWSWHPWAGVKLAGDDPQATVTKRSWTPGRARYKPQNHRAGNVDVSASPVVTSLVCFFHSHTRLRVQLNTRHSLRPLLSRANTQGSGKARRENADVRPPGCLKFESKIGALFTLPSRGRVAIASVGSPRRQIHRVCPAVGHGRSVRRRWRAHVTLPDPAIVELDADSVR
jgi:hypothetical protein